MFKPISESAFTLWTRCWSKYLTWSNHWSAPTSCIHHWGRETWLIPTNFIRSCLYEKDGSCLGLVSSPTITSLHSILSTTTGGGYRKVCTTHSTTPNSTAFFPWAMNTSEALPRRHAWQRTRQAHHGHRKWKAYPTHSDGFMSHPPNQLRGSMSSFTSDSSMTMATVTGTPTTRRFGTNGLPGTRPTGSSLVYLHHWRRLKKATFTRKAYTMACCPLCRKRQADNYGGVMIWDPYYDKSANYSSYAKRCAWDHVAWISGIHLVVRDDHIYMYCKLFTLYMLNVLLSHWWMFHHRYK